MTHHTEDPFPADDNLFLEARAFALSIDSIRRAQGKPNPADFPVGTPEWSAVIADFAADILRLPADPLSLPKPVARKKSCG
jgi:hypothetical protein